MDFFLTGKSSLEDRSDSLVSTSIQPLDSLKRAEQAEHQLLLTVITGGFDAFFFQGE